MNRRADGCQVLLKVYWWAVDSIIQRPMIVTLMTMWRSGLESRVQQRNYNQRAP